MSEQPLVSIILPVYNGESTLMRAVQSVFAQDYPFIELIVVDDGSSDDTGKICANLANLNSNIKVITVENGGVSRARNIGMDAASGRYITFLDVDDELMPDFVSAGLKTLVETRADIVCTNAYYVDNGSMVTKMRPFNPHRAIVTSGRGKDQLIQQLYYSDAVPFYGDFLRAPWGKIYSAELLMGSHIQFPCEVAVGEDAIFLLRAFYYANRIAIDGEYRYKYYRSSQSVTGRADQHFYERRVTEYRALKFALDDIHYSIKNIDAIYWHRANFENIGNAVKSSKSTLRKIKLIRDFYKEKYPKQYLAIPLSGKKDVARAYLMRSHQYLLMAIMDYYSKKRLFAS